MKREFGFTQARFPSARHISLSCQREASKIPPDRSPAKSLMPPPIPPRPGKQRLRHRAAVSPRPNDGPAIMSCCGGKKGGCHSERSEASEIPPNQNTAKSLDLLPQRPRSASVRRAGAVREPSLCCAAAAWQLMHSMLANPPSTYG